MVMMHSIEDQCDTCALSLNHFVEFVERFEKEIRKGKIVVTFDDGYESVYTKCFPLFLEKGLPFLCFLVSGFIGKPGFLSGTQVSEMLATGLLTIGSHGKNHTILCGLNAADAEVEIIQSKVELEAIFGVNISLFAYSHGFADRQAIKLLKKAGYRQAFVASSNLSNFVRCDRFRIPRFNLKEESFASVMAEIGNL